MHLQPSQGKDKVGLEEPRLCFWKAEGVNKKKKQTNTAFNQKRVFTGLYCIFFPLRMFRFILYLLKITSKLKYNVINQLRIKKK